MCFSAEASFGAAAVLVPAGAWCAWQAAHGDRRLLPLALVPALFGTQQLAEGFVWQALNQGTDAVGPALVFLFFALAVWPMWIPLCALCVAAVPWKRRLIGMILLAGLGWLVYLYGPILLAPEAHLRVRVVHHHIQYDYSSLPLYQYVPRQVLRVLYLLNIAVPLGIGGCANPVLRGFGLLFGASVAVSWAFYSYAFTSVWCFFAAILSGYLCLVFRSPGSSFRGEARNDDPREPEDQAT